MSLLRKNVERMAPYVPGEQPRDRTYVKLNTNENPYPPSPAVAELIRSVDIQALRLYPDPVSLRLRQALGLPEPHHGFGRPLP